MLNPFLDEEEGVINPKWHFLVSFLAYIDVALNHQSELSEKIISRKKWKNKRVVFSCKSLKKWAKQLENGDL